jgi:hypothetical protein
MLGFPWAVGAPPKSKSAGIDESVSAYSYFNIVFYEIFDFRILIHFERYKKVKAYQQC